MKIRLYTTNSDAGFGSCGRTDTDAEVNTNLLAGDKATSLWRLCSANALRDDGIRHDIVERSKKYAADLGAPLREHIYDDWLEVECSSSTSRLTLRYRDRSTRGTARPLVLPAPGTARTR